MAHSNRRRALRTTSVPKFKKRPRVKPTTTFFRTLSIFFILLVLFVVIGGYFFRRQVSLLSFKVSDFHAHTHTTSNRPIALKIPSAGIEVQIIPATASRGSWPTHTSAATFLSTSAQPLEGGNIIIYAPNSATLFGSLSQVRVGDMITIQTSDLKKYEYLIQETKTVDPSQVESLLPTTSEVVTLFTSSGFFNSKRLVVRATPIRLPTF